MRNPPDSWSWVVGRVWCIGVHCVTKGGQVALAATYSISCLQMMLCSAWTLLMCLRYRMLLCASSFLIFCASSSYVDRTSFLIVFVLSGQQLYFYTGFGRPTVYLSLP